MSETVGLASIGLGWWGNVLADAVSKVDGATITSCYARSGDSRSVFAENHSCSNASSLDEIWEDDEVTGVLLATPHSVRGELISAAAAAGKHVFVEKPLALTVEEATASARAASDAGVVLQVGHNKRRQTGNRRLHQMATTGALGDLQYIETNISVPVAFKTDLPEWRKEPEQLPAGGMTPLGVHHVDTIRYLGGPITQVTALSKRVYGALDVDDVTAMLFELESGPLAYLVTLLATTGVNTVKVYGSEAAAWTEQDGARLFVQNRGDGSTEELPIEPIDTIADEMAEFVSCIGSGAEPETGASAAIPVVAVLEGIIESIDTGKSVSVSG